MSVFVNFKICDNADECSGIEVCPAEALFWDEQEETVKTDNEKCISCDACEEACPAGAIRVAHDVLEETQIIKDIEDDPRTLEGLLIERYGASPIDDEILIDIKTAVSRIKESTSMIVVEVIDADDTPCLINSVSISEVFLDTEYEYYKVTISDEEYHAFAELYEISECPTLLVFRNHVIAARMDGPVENGDYIQKMDFIKKIRKEIGG